MRHRGMLALLVSIGALGCGRSQADHPPADPSPPSASAQPSGSPVNAPSERLAFRCLAIDQTLWLVGGINLGEPEEDRATFTFDLPAAQWRRGPDLGQRAVFAAAASRGQSIIVVGGAGERDAPTAGAGLLDTASGAWHALPDMPTPRSRLTGEVVGDAFFAIGGLGPLGEGANANLAAVERLDLTTRTWSAAAPMHTGRHAHASAVLGGCIYVSGGYTGDDHAMTPSVERFNPRTNQWTIVAPMNHPRAFHAMIAWGGTLLAIGSRGPQESEERIERYDPQLDQWTDLGPCPEPRHRAGAATIDALVYLVGGETASGDPRTWVTLFDPESMHWADVPAP